MVIGNFCFESVHVAKHFVSRILHMRQLRLHPLIGFLNSCSDVLNKLSGYNSSVPFLLGLELGLGLGNDQCTVSRLGVIGLSLALTSLFLNDGLFLYASIGGFGKILFRRLCFMSFQCFIRIRFIL